MNDVPIYTPSEWGESYWFYEGIEDLRQRRALALISHFGTPGGGDKVAFISEYIVIAVQPEPGVTDNVDLVIRPLDAFIHDYYQSILRDADPMALRWVEKIVQWPELGC